MEFRIRRHDGAWCWHLVSAVPVRDSADRIVKWYGAALNVDARRRAEDTALQLARRLGRTLESMRDGVLMLDREWRITYVNPRGEGLLQRRFDELSARSLWDAFPESVGAPLGAACRRAMQSGEPASLVAHYARLVAWFEVDLYPSEDGLALYFRDVSEERRARRQLEEQAALLDEAQDAILVRKLDHRISFWNRGAERLYGWSASEAVGRSAEELLYDEPSSFRRATEAVLTCGRWSGRIVKLRRDGERRTVEANWSLVRDARGTPTSILAIDTDVTDRLHLEDQLRQSQRLEAIGQLTGGVAHDFNNLLTVILGNAELLVEQLDHDRRLRPLAELTRTAAERGAELTRSLLAFARRQPLDPKRIDVNRLLAGMDGLLRRALGEQVEVELVRGGGLWPALIDATQLESAVLNLCINARDAMPNGGKLTVETANVHLDQDYADVNEGVRPGQYVMIAVSDTGTGMTPEDAARAFDPFFTTKPVGQGTGLGLSMVYGFIKQSRGHVKIYTELGQGTTLKLYLPRASSDGDEVLALPVGESQRGSERILLVEDDELVRGHVASQLESLGYRVVLARNAAEALAVIETDADLDLLFTDIVMPGGMNGRELADAARGLRPELPVLFTSGYTENAVVHHGRLDPGVHLLNKPYRRQELAAKIRLVLSSATGASR